MTVKCSSHWVKKGVAIAALSSLGLANLASAAICSFKVDNDWGSGYTATITINNNSNSTINGWNVSWSFSSNRVTSAWNTVLSGSNPYSAVPVSYNTVIQPNQSVSFGIQADRNGKPAEIPVISGTVCSDTISSSSSVTSSSSSSSVTSSSSSSSSVTSSSSSSSSNSSNVGFVTKHGRLKTIDGRMVDQNNMPLALHGMSTHGLQWFGNLYNKDSIRWLRDDWNLNVIRAAMYTREGGYLDNPSVINKVWEIVDAAIAADIYVIVDWHILSDRNPLTNKEAAKDFFRKVTAKYGNDPHIIYEIANEPNGADVRWKPVIKAYAEELIPVIRDPKNGAPDAFIIVGTADWSKRLDEVVVDPLTYANVAYAIHFYACSSAHQGPLRAIVKAAAEAKLPIFSSEWGAATFDGKLTCNDQATIWMDLLDQYGIGWTNWSLSTAGETSAALIGGASNNGGWPTSQLTVSGNLVRNRMKAYKYDGSSLSSSSSSSSISSSSSSVVTTGNLAFKKPAVATTVNAGLNAGNAFDGKGTTRWSSTYTDLNFITVDLGASFAINRVVLSWETAFGSAYEILVSTDNITWTSVFSTTTGDGGVDTILFNTTNARYVRMSGTKRATKWGYSLWEYEVYSPSFSSAASSSSLSSASSSLVSSSVSSVASSSLVSSSSVVSSSVSSSSLSSSSSVSSSVASSSSSILSSSSVSSSVQSSSSSSAVSITRVDNPFVGAVWYVDPKWQANALKEPNGALIANYNTAVWLDRTGAIAPKDGIAWGLADHLDAALSQKANLVQIVIYNLPNRDCNALSSNGELIMAQNGFNSYKNDYINPIVSILSNPKYNSLRIVAIVEPDSLPNLVTNLSVPKCQEAMGPGGYADGVKYTLNALFPLANVYSYIDIGHSGWLGWDNNLNAASTFIANVIKGTTNGVNSVAGFISNTSNYTPLKEPFLDALANSALPGSNGSIQVRQSKFYEWNPVFSELAFVQAFRKSMIAQGFPASIGMLVDTSRNGWGGASRPQALSTSADLETFINQSRIDRRTHRGMWCNQAGGIGERPTIAPEVGVDAYVWVKPPGESDGAASIELSVDPTDPAKGFDRFCDPTYVVPSTGLPTGAMPGAPVAGRWFSNGFKTLIDNAYPPLK